MLVYVSGVFNRLSKIVSNDNSDIGFVKTKFHLFLKVNIPQAKHSGSNITYNRHKKREDSLETRGVLLIFSPELEISGVAVQGIHQNSKKWRLLLGTAQ